MSNRTDWPELVEDIFDTHGISLMGEDGGTTWMAELKTRLESELHNAFVAGQENIERPDAIEEANKRAQKEVNLGGSTPFHDKHRDKTPVGNMTTEQLQDEIDRRNGIGPFKSMFALVKVVGIGHDGSKNTRVHWEYQDIDVNTFHATYSQTAMELKLTRTKK